MIYSRIPLFFYSLLLAIAPVLLAAGEAHATRSIIFPVIGDAQFSNDFNAPRSNGPHHATDIFANKHQKIVAAASGTITYVPYPQPSYGYAVFITDDQGYDYTYIHLNNDNPGTDDGNGGGMRAYAPDVRAGNRVVRGQHIGYVGDSGNAESTPPHLHFEMRRPDGSIINPYDSLRAAQRLAVPVAYPALAGELLPYGNRFNGSVSLAIGNLDTDPQPEFVTGVGKAGSPHVRAFEANNVPLATSFYAYDATFKGGVDTALGDVNGDGIDEIITGPGPGMAPQLKVFGADESLLASFMAYDPGYKGGIFVAAGDVDADGVDEIITGTRQSVGPRVRTFELNGTPGASFLAYSSAFKGGVDVAAADVDGVLGDEIITGAGPGGGPEVGIFTGGGTKLSSFYAYVSTFTGGVRVSAANVRTLTPAAEIATVQATKSLAHARLYTMNGGRIAERYDIVEPWWRGGYDIAAEQGMTLVSAGEGRRGSVRPGVR